MAQNIAVEAFEMMIDWQSMTADAWETSTDPSTMLAVIQPTASERKLRLWCAAVAACSPKYAKFWTHSKWSDGKHDPVIVQTPPIEMAKNWARNFVGSQAEGEASPQTKADLLRCVFCNPFRSKVDVHSKHIRSGRSGLVSHDPAWLSWQNGTVPAIAARIYEDRRWQDMGILADSLEESGCDNEAIIAHCRGNGPHARGCWVLDLVLGKE